jgi:hypothetical protein
MAKNGRKRVFDPSIFYDEQLTCPQCKWTGNGDEAILIDLYNLTAGKEVRCPKCDTLLGILPVENKNDIGDSGDELGFQIG